MSHLMKVILSFVASQLRGVCLPVLQFVGTALVARPAPDEATVRVGDGPSSAAYEPMEAI